VDKSVVIDTVEAIVKQVEARCSIPLNQDTHVVGEVDVVGEFGGGERNDRGENLVEFATAHNLKIINTFF
jgi:hypothetical protein